MEERKEQDELRQAGQKKEIGPDAFDLEYGGPGETIGKIGREIPDQAIKEDF